MDVTDEVAEAEADVVALDVTVKDSEADMLDDTVLVADEVTVVATVSVSVVVWDDVAELVTVVDKDSDCVLVAVVDCDVVALLVTDVMALDDTEVVPVEVTDDVWDDD